jgi:Rab-GTPase-TBC domain
MAWGKNTHFLLVVANGRQRLLFRVLPCMSLNFPKQGYVQGMAPIAATLLCYYPDHIAFVMLVQLWRTRDSRISFPKNLMG